MNAPKPPRPTIIERSDFELDCIREFSHSGMQLGASVSREERRERIRIAILRENKQHLPWRQTTLTYAEVYQRVYSKRLELRTADEEERWRSWAPVAPISAAVLTDNDGDDDGEDGRL